MFLNFSNNETVVLLFHKKQKNIEPAKELPNKMIMEYIENKYGFKVHLAYIAEVKRDLGLPMYGAPHAVEELKQPRKHPAPDTGKGRSNKGCTEAFSSNIKSK